MKTFVISGGRISDAFVARQLEAAAPECVIAADRGMECCFRLGIVPDYVVGDFDSVSADVREAAYGWHTRIAELNPVKDDTDTEAALRLALERTSGDIVILGATGSRMDHVLANIAVLGLGLERRRPMELLDECNRVRLMDAPFSIARESQHGKYVSLIPYAGSVVGITLSGFLYPLQDATIGPFTSLGVSNEIVAPVAKVEWKEGILIVVESRDEALS